MVAVRGYLSKSEEAIIVTQLLLVACCVFACPLLMGGIMWAMSRDWEGKRLERELRRLERQADNATSVATERKSLDPHHGVVARRLVMSGSRPVRVPRKRPRMSPCASTTTMVGGASTSHGPVVDSSGSKTLG